MSVGRILRRTAVCSAIFSLSLASGCVATRTGSHFDETTNFGAYDTFSWIDDRPYITGEPSLLPSPLMQRIIQEEIVAQLEQLGFRYVDERSAADFVVAYTIGSRETIKVESYPPAYRGMWGWHLPGSYYHVRETRIHSYTERTLGVDIFDNESGKPVWHGWAQKSITSADQRDPGPNIRKGLRRLFVGFPGSGP